MTRLRSGITLFDLLMLIALFALGFALFLPAIGSARLSAARQASMNNLKQIGIALHSYHDATNSLPTGADEQGFSTFTHILPYIEQDSVYRRIDFKKAPTDKANAEMRALVIKTYLNPLDSVRSVTSDAGACNYMVCAGDQPAMEKNTGMYFPGSKIRLADVTDGLSNTLMVGETLKGDSGVQATTVSRQHVVLKADALKGIQPETGVPDWKDSKNIAADRGASWMDGKFLQTIFTGTRTVDDEKPDVDCGGKGGLTGLRSNGGNVAILLGDGFVRRINKKTELRIIQLISNRNDGQPIPVF